MNLKGFCVDSESGEYGRLPEVSSKHNLVEHLACGFSEHLKYCGQGLGSWSSSEMVLRPVGGRF